MSLITIRYATPADAELIAEMSRTSFYEAFAKDNTKEDMDIFMNEQFTKEELMNEVELSEGIFMLAYIDEEPVGYARLRLKNSLAHEQAIEIARIYALDKAIGKGVGKALMQECINKAIELKMKSIWLGVWEKNERAISFYQRWGFERFGEHQFLLGTDLQTDWLLKKTL
ncbi:GNAT family N-acetyltransferase [Lacibacter sp. H375]|uniref:GNAT family N-acetyltransferase n=1 Tax=Lacibacter sp. H375 TaxID=3133424 RepID=UPI0030BB9A9A